jgi:hypothetical protein
MFTVVNSQCKKSLSSSAKQRYSLPRMLKNNSQMEKGFFMKKAVFVSALLLAFVGSVAEAMVADNFKCTINAYNPDGSTSYGGQANISSIRREWGLSSDPKKWMTSSEVEMMAQGVGSRAKLSLRYQFAGILNAEGKLLSAKGFVCVSFLADKVGVSGVSINCPPAHADPWAQDAYGWDKVEVKFGVPVFDVTKIRPFGATLADGSRVLFQCQLLGTEQ